MKLELDPQKERILLQVMTQEELDNRLQGFINDWVNGMISNYYASVKKLPEILTELDSVNTINTIDKVDNL